MVDSTAADQQAHTSGGVGGETYVTCPDHDGEMFGPHPDARNTLSYCPYCGVEATDGDHRPHEGRFEVFCPETIMSTYRYCPNCGDRIEGVR